jgi:hypothetical protein
MARKDRDPIPDDLTPEERKAVERQGDQLAWERSQGSIPGFGEHGFGSSGDD